MAFHKAKALQDAEKSVAQGKTSQAIRQYQEILDNDPTDVSLLNTIGDLYIRDKNITEGLRQFHKLAEAYVREGFNVKAIAIYKKISKVDANSVDTLMKLAELYQLQGLSREAREQYLQAAEFFKKRNQAERVLEVLRKLVQLDPENINFRNRLAAECEKSGGPGDAAHAYLEVAEILLRRNEQSAAEAALKKAGDLDPHNSRIHLLRARVAIARGQPDEAEKIINGSPALQADNAGKRILLDAYLAAPKLPEAKKLVLEVFRANPADFAPVSSVSALMVEEGSIDEAYQLLSDVSDTLISQNNAAPLMEALRRVWDKAPNHIPTLELIHRVCERTADELTLPEVLEALGRAHEKAGDLEQAEAAYLKLTQREPENESHRGLLHEVQTKLGREIKPVEISDPDMPLSVDDAAEDAAPQPAEVDVEQQQMVNEALENSDLFGRYNLTEKAIAELEKVLQYYPDQIVIHRRILEIARKGFPERAAVAANRLARILAKHGDAETAQQYSAIAASKGSIGEIQLPSPPPGKAATEESPAPAPAPIEKPVPATTAEFAISPTAPEEPAAVAPPTPAEVSFDLAPPNAVDEPAPPPLSPAVTGQTMELDLSVDLEAMAAMSLEAPAPSTPGPAAPPPAGTPPHQPEEITLSSEEISPLPEFEPMESLAETPQEVPAPPAASGDAGAPADLEDSRIEVEFYLENGFLDEARQSVAALEAKFPGNPHVVELRQRLDEKTSEPPPAEVPQQAASASESSASQAPVDTPRSEPEPEAASAPVNEPEVAASPAPEPMHEELLHEEWELPTSYAATPQLETEAASDSATSPSFAGHEGLHPPSESAAPTHEAAEEPPIAAGAGMGMLDDLAGDLASSLNGLSAMTGELPPDTAPGKTADPATAAPQGAQHLDGLLAEMEDAGGSPASRDDPETHYNLGVAFREMGLLDESIGEFQKIVMGAGKGNFPPNFLQACSLLAICFMDKGMAAIAVKWYLRALETPGLDEEAQISLQYDLGVAYEQSGDSRNALERFTEVYSQNIDFRDVADKIRELQQKV